MNLDSSMLRASERAHARSDARTKRAALATDVLRRVVAVARFLPNVPRPTKDTLELRLECGHRHAWLRRSPESLSASDDTLRLLGSEVPCARCSTSRRFHRAVVTREQLLQTRV